MLSHVIPYCYSDKVGSIKLQFTRKSRLISQLSANIPASEKGVYFFYNPAINFHIAQKSVRKMPVLICWRCFVFFRCTLQNLTRKKACRSQEKKQIVLNVTASRKLENKELFRSLKKKFNHERQNVQSLDDSVFKSDWNFSLLRTVGLFYSVLNSVLYKTHKFKESAHNFC